MPLNFSFYRKDDNETLFKGQLECQRCSYTRERHQCKRNTCKYLPMCWQHAAITYGVKVAPSTIAGAGNGLFALRDFKAGEWIAPLLGEIITAAEGDRRYGEATAPYVVTHSGQHYDGALRRFIGHYSNSVFGKRGYPMRSKTNAVIGARNNQYPWLKVQQMKRIKAGTEILTDDGGEYRLDVNEYGSKTK
jgi:hypothetical protein